MSKELIERAEGIRDETLDGANTARRVGCVMVDTVKELDAVKAKLDEFLGVTYISQIKIPAEGGGAVLGIKTTCENWEVK